MFAVSRKTTSALIAVGLLMLAAAPTARAGITLAISSPGSLAAPAVFAVVGEPGVPVPVVSLDLSAALGGSYAGFSIPSFDTSQRYTGIAAPATSAIASQTAISLAFFGGAGTSGVLSIIATYTFDPASVNLPGNVVTAFGTLSSDLMLGDWKVSHSGTVEGASYTTGGPLSLTGPIPPAQITQISPTINTARAGVITVVQTITVTMGVGQSGNFQASTVVTASQQVVPEPSTLAAMASGVPVLGLMWLKRRKA